jgi:Tfp pilus assembly protein PilO
MTRSRQWTMGTAVVVLLILVGGWFGLVAPKHSAADDLRTQTTAQESNNLTLEAQVTMLKAQKAGLPAQEAKLATIRQHIPDNPALPSFIRSLSALAAASGVTLQSLAPVPPIPNASPPVTSALKPTGVVPVLQNVGMAIDLLGTYANVELFLNKLENLKRSFLVTGLQITTGSTTTAAAATTGSSSPPLSVIIAARVFDVSTIGVPGSSGQTGSASTGSTSAGSTATTAH